MNLLMVFFGFAGIAALDLPGMIKNRLWRDLAIYLVIFVLVLTLAALMALGVEVPSPIKMIQVLYRDVLHLSFKPS
jgi:predicted MFS family arabinose efflux permease